MYIVEREYDGSDYDEEEEPKPDLSEKTKNWAGRRVLVLNCDGELVQEVYPAHPCVCDCIGSCRQIDLDIRNGEVHLLYNFGYLNLWVLGWLC